MNTTRHASERPTPEQDDPALAFALAHHRWHRLNAETRSWTEPGRQHALAGAFLRYHAAKLTLMEAAPARTPHA